MELYSMPGIPEKQNPNMKKKYKGMAQPPVQKI
jgi:hypothetical protein